MNLPAYVKFGIVGYGPDLDETDEPYDDVAALCDAIRSEIRDTQDRLMDEASLVGKTLDFERYFHCREMVDELDNVAANLDYERRMTAPLYTDDRDALDATMLAIIDEKFPLCLDVDATHYLYVWEASA